jgi:hypothetical protein
MQIKFQGKKGHWGEGGWVDVSLLRYIWLVLNEYVTRIKIERG